MVGKHKKRHLKVRNKREADKTVQVEGVLVRMLKGHKCYLASRKTKRRENSHVEREALVFRERN